LSSETAAGGAWALLAVSFRYPRPDLHESFRGGGFAAELSLEMGKLGLGELPELRDLARLSLEMTDRFDLFESAYIDALDLADAKRGPSPYEASYSKGQAADVLLDVKRHYVESGLNIGSAERPDHVAVELEFLAHLANRQKDPTDGETFREAERRFLTAHLAHWMPAFSERLAERPGMEVHAKLAAIAGKLGTARAAAAPGPAES
jgi:DMSO reductase family type II enzyme chaperone